MSDNTHNNANNHNTNTQPIKLKSNEEKKHDRFMSSMTFASTNIHCDCDECGFSSTLTSSTMKSKNTTTTLLGDSIIRNYYNNSNLMMQSVIPCQERELVVRDNGVSIWKLVLPVGSEPLIEYRNNHRIVLVDSLPKNRTVRSIGEGIIGSQNESSTRKTVPWIEHNTYLYPSTGGTAIGWINEQQNSTSMDNNVLEMNADTSQDVTLFIFKITCDSIATNNNISLSSWSQQIVDIFQRYIHARDDNNDDGTDENLKSKIISKAQHDDGDDSNQCLMLSTEETNTLQKILDSLLNQNDSK